MKPFLPEMPPPIVAKIDQSRVMPMCLGKRLTQPVRALRHQDKMDVIGHQTIRPALSLCGLTAISDVVEVRLIVATIKENLLPSISSLGYVMWIPGQNNPWNTRHTVPP